MLNVGNDARIQFWDGIALRPHVRLFVYEDIPTHRPLTHIPLSKKEDKMMSKAIERLYERVSKRLDSITSGKESVLLESVTIPKG